MTRAAPTAPSQTPNLTPPLPTRGPTQQVPADLKAKIEDKVKAVKDAVAEDNTEKIKAAADDLSKEVMNLGAAVYGQGAQQQPDAAAGGAAGGAPGGSGSSSGGKDDDVIDAEVRGGGLIGAACNGLRVLGTPPICAGLRERGKGRRGHPAPWPSPTYSMRLDSPPTPAPAPSLRPTVRGQEEVSASTTRRGPPRAKLRRPHIGATPGARRLAPRPVAWSPLQLLFWAI
jgi:hypothetical protein